MKTQKTMGKAWPKAALFCLISYSTCAHAQQVVALPPAGPAPAPSQPTPGGVNAPSLSDFASAISKAGPLTQWGPISVRPHLYYRLLHSDGLLNRNQLESASSTIQVITAGSLFEIGKHWTLDYTLTRSDYSNRFIADSSDHSAALSGSIALGDWTFGFSQSYLTNSPTLIETAQQTSQEQYATAVNVSYRVGVRTLVEIGVSRSVRLANAASIDPQWTTADWYSWSTSDWVHYQFSPKVNAAVGVALGWDRIVNGADMKSTRPQIQATWRPTEKISATAEAGMEYRQIEDGAVSTLKTPVYSASVQYRPFDVTSISIGASRSVSASYFANQAAKSRAWTVDLSQRLFGKFYLSLGATHGETSYLATAQGIAATRIDKSEVYTARLRTAILRRGSIAVFHQLGRNASNENGFSFSSRQFGTEIGYQF